MLDVGWSDPKVRKNQIQSKTFHQGEIKSAEAMVKKLRANIRRLRSSSFRLRGVSLRDVSRFRTRRESAGKRFFHWLLVASEDPEAPGSNANSKKKQKTKGWTRWLHFTENGFSNNDLRGPSGGDGDSLEQTSACCSVTPWQSPEHNVIEKELKEWNAAAKSRQPSGKSSGRMFIAWRSALGGENVVWTDDSWCLS